MSDTRVRRRSGPGGAAREPGTRALPGGGDDGWGASVERRTRRRPLRLVALVLVVLLVTLAAVPFVVSGRITRIPVDGLTSAGGPFSGEAMTVLVVGSDSREGLTREQARALTTGTGFEGERTDTIFLMQVRGGDVALLAFPRDLWVPRCDGSVGRINVAQQLGGPSCLVQTIHDLSGIEINGYASVGFLGFVGLVDAVGGVELCLEAPIEDVRAGIDLPAGCQRLEGPDALGYARVRMIDNDLERINRQQRFVRALAAEIASPSVLLNPVALWRLSRDAGDAVTFDEGFGTIDLARLAWGARGMADGDLVATTVPTVPRTTSGGAAVLEPRVQEAEAIFARFRDGSILDHEQTALTPGDVRVAVLNGAGVNGLAGRVGDLLGGRGYEVVDIGNAPARDRTVVRHPPGARAAAELVARDLPADPLREETGEVTVVTVELGRDIAGLS